MPVYFSVVMGSTHKKPQQKRIDNGPPPPRMEWDAKKGRNVLNLDCCGGNRKDNDKSSICSIS